MLLLAKRDLRPPYHEFEGKPKCEGYWDEILKKFLVVIPSNLCDAN